jgi:hypothetical protein
LAKRNKVVEELNQARSAHPTNSQLIQALEKKLNALESELTPLQLHAKWLEQNRPYIEKVTEDLSWGRRPDTIQLIVDFGKIYASDSRACKTLVWSMYRNVESTLACGDRRLEWLDNWFRGSSCAASTIRIFEHVFSSTAFVPEKFVWIHSDTGNGFRGFELFYFLSTCKSRFGKCVEYAPYCPRHGHSVADLHLGHISQEVHRIKRSRAIIALEELADVSAEFPNTNASVHAADIDDERAIFADQKAHPPLLQHLRRPTGIRNVGHAQFCWTAADGREFSQDGVLRVRSSVVGGDFEIWDLDGRRPELCTRCSNFHQEAVRHADGAACPKKHDAVKGSVRPGIKVL